MKNFARSRDGFNFVVFTTAFAIFMVSKTAVGTFQVIFVSLICLAGW